MGEKSDEHSVSVVHLIWPPLGQEVFNNFILSYCKYRSGHPHQLVLLCNGVSSQDEISWYIKFIEEKNISYKLLLQPHSWQDLDAYFWAAGQLQSDYILFVNSYAEFLQHDWLKMYMDRATAPQVGITGATGSWQSYYSTVFVNNKWNWEKDQSFNHNFRKFKLLIKASLYWRFLFPAFPNPHIRTNAFILPRDLMLGLKHKPLKNKMDAFRLESGFNSITAQVRRRGLKVLVMDRNGKTYQENEWINSNVFWGGNQENLLIADNQTRKYELGNEELKKHLAFVAWGLNKEKISAVQNIDIHEVSG